MYLYRRSWGHHQWHTKRQREERDGVIETERSSAWSYYELLKEYPFGGEVQCQRILNKYVEQKQKYKKNSRSPTLTLPRSCVIVSSTKL